MAALFPGGRSIRRYQSLTVHLFAQVRWRHGVAFICSATTDGVEGPLPTVDDARAVCATVR
jgi:hypothetical protein